MGVRGLQAIHLTACNTACIGVESALIDLESAVAKRLLRMTALVTLKRWRGALLRMNPTPSLLVGGT
jgi:hypothetical protein